MKIVAKFLIQAIDGQIKHDFSFGLREAIEYQNWLNAGSHDYELCEISDMFKYDFTEYIPSGSIQFMKKFIAAYHDKHVLRPINIAGAFEHQWNNPR